MALDPVSRVRVNLEQASILLLESNTLSMSLLVQIIRGLGAKRLYRCASVEQARETAIDQSVDLAIIDSLPDGRGYDFVYWLRREASGLTRYAPVMITTGHTPTRDVARARDCGGHIIVRKPISPRVLLERILWVSKGSRAFLYSDGYAGPDRRFRGLGPPASGGRRREDQAAAVAAETQPREVS